MYAAEVIADSTAHGHRLVSIEVTMPRIVLAESSTHRAWSRNSASSRAIPIQTMIDRVRSGGFCPDPFTKNQKGMQAAEVLDEEGQKAAREVWVSAANHAIAFVDRLDVLGVHKQQANRLLEPWLWTTVIVTATEWGNFFALRCDKAAQPEMRRAAEVMLLAYEASTPVNRDGKTGADAWHLPYVLPEDREMAEQDEWDETGGSLIADRVANHLVKVSVGRCAAVSYLRQREPRGHAQEMALYERLLAGPHLSPFEHVARPMNESEYNFNRQNRAEWQPDKKTWRVLEPTHFLGNIQGFVQARKLVRNEHDFSLCKKLG